jgi:thymidylate kinase
MIVAFSGIDSSGKTTQIDLFEKYCKDNKICLGKIWGKGRGTPASCSLKA